MDAGIDSWAGDAGLRLGEVLGLRWEDVDLVAQRLTVARQIRKGVEGTPKGGGGEACR